MFYNKAEYYVDTYQDMLNIDCTMNCAGTVCLIINSGEIYMLDSKKQWRLFT